MVMDLRWGNSRGVDAGFDLQDVFSKINGSLKMKNVNPIRQKIGEWQICWIFMPQISMSNEPNVNLRFVRKSSLR